MKGIKEEPYFYATLELRAGGYPLIVLKYHDSPELSLDYLQSAVDGFIEVTNAYIPDPKLGYKLIVNENGCAEGLQPNILASLIAFQDIVGNAVIGVHKMTPEPDVYAMPIAEARKLQEILLNAFYAAFGND